jgi:tetratricopeptide (TPR) repeat protein
MMRQAGKGRLRGATLAVVSTAAVATLALAAATAVGGGAMGHNLDNLAALRVILGEGVTAGGEVRTANDYLSGLAAYADGDYASAATHLRAAQPTHGEFARHWLALSLEAQGKPQEGRVALDLHNPAELALFGDILLREWAAADEEDKQAHLARLQAGQPQWILPYANRLIEAQHLEDAATWTQAAPDFATSPDALVTLGNVRYLQERFDEAQLLFGQAYQLRPDAMTAYAYGRSLGLGLEPDRGAALLEEAARTADDALLPWVLRELGVSLARGGRCAEAQVVFERAAASDPGAENQARVATAIREYGEVCVPR